MTLTPNSTKQRLRAKEANGCLRDMVPREKELALTPINIMD